VRLRCHHADDAGDGDSTPAVVQCTRHCLPHCCTAAAELRLLSSALVQCNTLPETSVAI
jgi:hypothetical protein